MDWAAVGLKCGLEIHQRLGQKKLFCGCATEGEQKPIATVRRKLHAAASELGEVDIAALHEVARRRTYEYQIMPGNSCLVEMDEEPPHNLNQDVLDTILHVAMMVGAQPVDELQLMRKIVVDGSNTGGFQRTGLVAIGGSITVDGKPISITIVSIEEESAGIVSQSGDLSVFRLDRLGIPLIEVATGPDITTPEQARAVAESIGMVLRATGKVLRGIGTIRQDLNVSVRGGARCEIKGAQALDLISTLVEREAARQLKLIAIKDELAKRGVKQVDTEPTELSAIFKSTAAKILRAALDSGGMVLGVRLGGFGGLIGGKPDEPRLGRELADYARVRAGVKGIFHSDELPSYGITDAEVEAVRKALGCAKADSFVLVAEKERAAKAALAAVVGRAAAALKGVPAEVRNANPDGSTTFMRPMPGAARMYVETDVPPVRITKERVKALRATLPESAEAKRARLVEVLGPDLAGKMLRSRRLALYEKATAEGADAVIVAGTLEETLRALSRANVPVDNLTDDLLMEFFAAHKEGAFVKAAIPNILEELAGHPGPVKEVLKKLELGRVTGAGLEKLLEKERGKSVAELMAKWRLRVDPAELRAKLK